MVRTPSHTRVSALAIGVLLAAMLGVGGAGLAEAVEVTFSTPGTFSFAVPPGVTAMSVVARGAGGGSGSYFGGPGGAGGRAEATIGVTPGEALTITVGGHGPLGDYPFGSTRGGAYGGASDVRQGGSDLASRIIVAGGGGGGGSGVDENHPGGQGGDGGGLAGVPGSGTATASGGGGGTQTSGGLGGSGWVGGGEGTFGTVGFGGTSGGDLDSGGDGGEGGGGYYGGGGGAAGYYPNGGGGGGGGSGLVPEGGVLIAGGGSPAGAAGSVTLIFEARELSLGALEGGSFSLVVPSSITEIEVVALGAGGGGSNGGPGGRAEGVLSVSPGETLFFNVGGRGKLPSPTCYYNCSSGGFNGGGNGGQGGVFFYYYNRSYGAGGGGGGATDVRQGGSTPAHRVIVAGGGGGGAHTSGGAGGGLVGDDGTTYICLGYQDGGRGGRSPCGANTGNGSNAVAGAGGGGGGLCGGGAGDPAFADPFYYPSGTCSNCYCFAAGGGGGSGLVPAGGTLTTGGGSPAGQSGLVTLIMRCSPVAMGFDLTPNTLNLQSMGHWVTATLEPEPPVTPADIDVASILLNGTVPVDGSGPISIGDADDDGLPDLTVKFDRAAVELVVEEGDAVPVTVTGAAAGGCFEVIDVIRVRRAHVTAPAGGSVHPAGSTVEVRWTTPSGIDIESVALLSSTDDGLSWSLEASGLPNTGSAAWVVPSVTTASGRVAIVLVESSDETGFIVDGVMGTSGTFSIENVTAVEDLGKAEFALRHVTPNPAHDRLGVAFSLPDGRASVRLEVFSVAGRLVASREVGGLGPGAHTVTLGERARLASGVYIVRLTQAGKSLTTRAVVVR